MKFTKIFTSLALLSVLVFGSLAFTGVAGAQTLGNQNQYVGPFVPGNSYSDNMYLGRFFRSPLFSYSSTSLVVTYTPGFIDIGNGDVAVVQNTTLTLTASQSSCALPALTGCNYIYSNSTGTLAVTTTLATAVASGNSLMAMATTSSSGVLTLVAPYQLTYGSFSGSPSLSPLSVVENCGATTGATQNCAKTVVPAPITVFGNVTLNGAATQNITTLPFTSLTSYSCVGNDFTTAAGIITFSAYTSGAQATIKESGGTTSDVIYYICVGS